jgi:hypothetical protein
MPKPLFDDCQGQAFQDSEVFFSRQQEKVPLSVLHLYFSCVFYRI